MFGTGFPKSWSTLRKLLWLRFLQAAQAVLETVTGTAPLTLSNAIAAAIHSLTRYGLCEQRNLPKGYTELDYIQSDGDQYIDLNTTLNQDDVIEIEFELTASQNSRNIFGYRNGASSNNIMLFFGGTNNKVFIDFNNSDYAPYRLSYDCTVGTKYKAVISKSRRAFLSADGTVLAENTTLCEDTISCPSAYLFHASGSPAYSSEGLVKIYSCVINGKRNLVGAKDSANVVEMYDKVSAAPFANAGTGSFTAGPVATPTPDRPMGIVTNNGVLRYSANMANVNEQTASVGYYISVQGVVTADTMNWFYQAYIPVKPNTTYTLSISQPVYYVTISEYSTAEDSGFIVRKPGVTGGNTSLTITTEANTNFIRFGTNINRDTVTLERVLAINWMLNEGSTAIPYAPYVEGGIYTDGTPEVLTVSGKNLLDLGSKTFERAATFDISGIPAGDYVLSAVVTSDDTDFTTCRVVFCDADGTIDESIQMQRSAGGERVSRSLIFTVTVTKILLYASKDDTSSQGDTATFADIQLELGSTATDYQPYVAPQTVTDIPMLLSVGDYKDSAEIISGLQTHKIGVKVLDGTEGWAKYNDVFFCNDMISPADLNTACVCTHYVGVKGSTALTSMSDGQIKTGTSSSTRRLFIRDDSCETADDLTAKLSAMFAAGTPPILVYPLATETTEQGTAHALTTAEGTNIVDVTANVGPVEAKVEYMKAA